MSLRTRIALLVGLTVLVASAIAGAGIAISSQSVGIARVDEALLNDIDEFSVDERLLRELNFNFRARQAACDQNAGDDAELAEPAPEPPQPGRRQRPAYFPEFASNLQLVAIRGDSVAACETLPIDSADQRIATEGAGEQFRSVTIDGERYRILTRGFENVGAVQLARSLELTEDAVQSLLVRTLGFGALGALLASAFGWLFASRATKPVQLLSATAERVAATQDLNERIDDTGTDEIGTLASSFNTMLSSLATLREQQARLVQDAGHELRTPLTSIRTNVELLQRHTDMDPVVRQQILTDIDSELSELTDLTSEVIDSAAQVPTTKDGREEVRLLDLTERTAERARRRHRREVNVYVVGEPEDTAVVGDVSMLTRALTNLVNNAIKFSDDSIGVVVSGTSVVVRDRGPGIPVEDLDNIFDRFYRATAARSAPGSGLGLAIVKSIIEGHGGSVRATNQPGGGAEVGFDLPGLDATPRP